MLKQQLACYNQIHTQIKGRGPGGVEFGLRLTCAHSVSGLIKIMRPSSVEKHGPVLMVSTKGGSTSVRTEVNRDDSHGAGDSAARGGTAHGVGAGGDDTGGLIEVVWQETLPQTGKREQQGQQLEPQPQRWKQLEPQLLEPQQLGRRQVVLQQVV